MAKNYIKVNAKVGDTVRPKVAAPTGIRAGRRCAIWSVGSPRRCCRTTICIWPTRCGRPANCGAGSLEVRRETEDSATLVIKPGWGFSFDYQPGQYIGIGVLMDGRWRWRSYSLTSAPVAGSQTITITVKAMPEGFLSSHLVGGVAPGTIVRLAAPQGNFVMPDPAPAKVLFLTAGSGITPVMSMLRTLARRNQIFDIVHLHSAPTEADVMFAGELAALAETHPGYRLRVRATRTEGRLDLSNLDAEVADWRERQTWACGPEAMLGDAERLWSGGGLDAALHLERFAVSRAAPHGAGGAVTFERSGKTVVADAATSLMDAGSRRACRCRSAAEWVSVRHAWSVWSTDTCVTCGPASSMSRVPGCKPACRPRPATACWTSDSYSLVTYGVVGYGSVGTTRGGRRWQLQTFQRSRT